MAKKSKVTEYRALRGINYVNEETGEENRVAAGDKITDLSENAVETELAAGNIEEWVPRQIGNVYDSEDAEISGVRSRRSHGEINVKEVGE